ncbi:Protein of unknown function DUF247 [Panicum miliaceum]|uniref:Uncharacterized protein n=1 Tax=Panicum miliaceum TaxID=4540 RepID=A0A3L6SJF1_PANMI|nr:Protein of unknown function DUF247 [Panicum miliaceum]
MASVTTSLEASVEATLSTLGAETQQRLAQPFTIFRVPAYIREGKRTAYEPRMVSIGPYYHGAAGLRAMEDHKWLYLHDLLFVRNTAVSSSLLIQEMRSLEPRARACYSERPLLGSDDFVRMLLLDGCFILEFFFKWYDKVPDALCDVGWGLTLVNADLLLLENQIPFFVVERLYGAIAGAQGGTREHLFKILFNYIGDEKQTTAEPPSDTIEIHHLLHMYYESFVPKRPPPESEKKTTTPSATLKVIPRATEMSAAGVSFVRRSAPHAQDKYDVAFNAGRGVMEIPVMVVDDVERSLLINLIAFEQSQGGDDAGVVTSYVSLMGMLVRTPQDVELLRRRGILDNMLADDEEAAQFFSHLGDVGTINYDRQVFSGLCEDVQRYCDSWWHRNRAALRRDYFSSPWSAISFVVAGLVVALAATQTSRRIANQPLAKIVSSKRAEVLLMQRFDGVPALEGPSEADKKMVADYFDANFSIKYMEATRELFLSLRSNRPAEAAARRDG